MPTDIITIVKQIQEAAQEASTTSGNPEQRLRELVSPLWDKYIREKRIGLNFEGRDERMLATGRADTVFNRLILEYKKPGVINSDNKRNRKVIAQVKGYIEDLANEERWKEERLLGVAFDGKHFLFIRKVKRWIEEEPVPVDEESVERFLLTLEKLTTKAALVPENLIRDFAVGTGSLNYVASNAIKAFYHTIITDTNPRVKAFFDQWSLQFAEVHGTIESKKFNPKTLFDTYGFKKDEQEDFNYLAFFFSLDTYYGLLMKLLAYQVVGFYTFKDLAGLPLTDWERLDDDRLKEKLEQLEEGGIFRAEPLNIRNFLEGDLLSWYLYEWNKDIYIAVRGIIERLNQYDPETMELVPDETRDILKKLYQFLVPKQIRHDLGEYYTPDWLAERCLNQVGYGIKVKGLLKKRLLDPGCGSGTFVVLGIKRAKEHAKLYGIDPAETLKLITRNIVGFDLNPLAVISARTNYLLAIADLLKYKKEEITIPIYLCDSINPPSAIEQADLHDEDAGYYEIITSVGRFRFPDVLVKKDMVVRMTSLLEDSVKKNQTKEQFISRIFNEENLSDEQKERVNLILGNTYLKLIDLEKKGINGIWARIIKNAFAPLFMGIFDYIAGNPPWVNWEDLPTGYREQTKILWKYYNLFSLSGKEGRYGGGKKDISMLMLYVSVDKYLGEDCKLCFVITQSVFKTKGAGDGFRQFRLRNNGGYLQIIQVDDMVKLQPFEGANNRTSVVLIRKGKQTKYPISYILWKKKNKGKLNIDLSLTEVEDITSRSILHAKPISSLSSPWLTARPKSLTSIEKIINKSNYQAKEGANNGGLAGVYWTRIIEKEESGLVKIQNLYDSGKKIVNSVEANIEVSIVYPLLRWSDMKRWEYIITDSILIPYKSQDFSRPLNTEEIPPNALSYFNRFENQLLERALYKRYLLPLNYPFYSIYNVGDHSLFTYKVCWQTMGENLNCVVVSKSDINELLKNEKVIVPQHTIVYIPTENKTEAHYICALMNSSIAQFIAKSYSMGKSFGNPHIMEYIPIQIYEEGNRKHNMLADLSMQCHKKTYEGINIRDIEEQIDHIAAELWGLTTDELNDIRKSLKELN